MSVKKECGNCFYYQQENRLEYGYVDMCGYYDLIKESYQTCQHFRKSESIVIREQEAIIAKLTEALGHVSFIISKSRASSSTPVTEWKYEVSEFNKTLQEIKEME